MHACTIIARNYLAHARVLVESFLRHHPDGTFTVLILDDLGEPVARSERFEALSPFDIGMARDEVRRMGMIYGLTEFATAVKPWLMRTLLDRGWDEVVYLDPDIEFFEPIDDIFGLARDHGIVLIPHMMEPLSPRITEPVETMVLLAGAYNLGFIALGNDVGEFLDWWCERLSRNCLIAPDRARFVDQRWVDLVPGLFPTSILRDDPGVDVAYWNLQRRSVDWDGERYLVDGYRLRFFHYSGFDPNMPWLLSKFQGPKPAVLLSDRSDLQRLCLEYRNKLLRQGFAETAVLPYGWNSLPGGMPVNERIRRLYREALARAEDPDDPQPEEEPPIPFDPEQHSGFLAWLNAPSYHPVAPAPTISRYFEALWHERTDLQEAFPNPRWDDTVAYRRWIITQGRYQDETPFELVPRPPRPRASAPAPQQKLERGVNIAGYFRTESGVGEHGRRILEGVQAAGIPFATLTLRGAHSRHDHVFEERRHGVPYSMNVVCVNADEILYFRHDVGPQLFEGRYTAGFWAWELPSFPEIFHQAFTTVDEVWVGSDFVRDAIATQTEKPVLTVPLPVGIPQIRPGITIPFGDDSFRFRFLFVFDFLSFAERKNPLGLIEAFCRAFRPGEGPTLLIKTINGERAVEELERLRYLAGERPDIRVVDGYLSQEEREALIATADCYVSLHRAEGFGFTMAEAMAAGVPTIGTGYSGNLAYMTDENSYLVPYTIGTVPDGLGPYPAGVEWAEPDLDAAATLMRHVVESPDDSRARAARASADIAERHSAARMGEFIASRIAVAGTTREVELAPAEVG